MTAGDVAINAEAPGNLTPCAPVSSPHVASGKVTPTNESLNDDSTAADADSVCETLDGANDDAADACPICLMPFIKNEHRNCFFCCIF